MYFYINSKGDNIIVIKINFLTDKKRVQNNSVT